MSPCLHAAAAPEQPGDPVPPTTPVEVGEMVSGTQRAVRTALEWLARGVDGWFGDRPFEQGGGVTDGRASLGLLERHGERTDWQLRFNARFHLPNAGRLGYLFVGRDNEHELVSDQPDTHHRFLQSQGEGEQSFFAGYGLWLLDRLDARIGVRGRLEPYAQLRYRQPWQPWEAGRVELRETVFWTVADTLGSTTALSVEHELAPTLALRWLQLGTATRRDTRLEWSSVLGAYQLLGERRLLALELLAQGKEGSGVGTTDAGVRVRWQQPLRGDELSGEIIVGRFWPRPDATRARTAVWALGIGLELRF